MRLIYSIIGLQFLLLVMDRFPFGLSVLSIVSHAVYAQNLRRFPIVKLTDPLFLLSCGTSPFMHLRTISPRNPPSICIYPRLTYSSSRNPQPLPLVPPLLCSALALRPGLSLCPRHISSYLHRNSLLLWAVRVACPLRPLRLSLGWRERLAEHGFRVCDR